jgi:hypothetical protein
MGSTNDTTIPDIKATINDTLIPLLPTLPVHPTWLQVAFALDNVTITPQMLQGFDVDSIWGITASQAESMPRATIEALAQNFPSFILVDTISGFDCTGICILGPARNLMRDDTMAVVGAAYRRCVNNNTCPAPTTATSSTSSSSSSSASISSLSSSTTNASLSTLTSTLSPTSGPATTTSSSSSPSAHSNARYLLSFLLFFFFFPNLQ